MTVTSLLSVTTQVDAALDVIARDREYVMTERSSALRSRKLAALYEHEARWWSVLVEQSRTRVHWRAALSAREHARQTALCWRRRAAMQRAREAGGAT
jgi:hypothetical protein